MGVMGYKEGERGKDDCTQNNHKRGRDTLYGVIICEGCVFLEVQRSHDDEYVFLKYVELDDTPIKKVEEGCRELYNKAHRFSTPCT